MTMRLFRPAALAIIAALSTVLPGSLPHLCSGPSARTAAAQHTVRLLVTATAYNDHESPTASGVMPHPGTLTVSRDLLQVLPFGTVVRIRGWRYRVQDTMAERWRKRVDIWMPSRDEAVRWGVRSVVLEVLPTRFPAADELNYTSITVGLVLEAIPNGQTRRLLRIAQRWAAHPWPEDPGA